MAQSPDLKLCGESPLLEGILKWCHTQPRAKDPAADIFFRQINPAWIRRFVLRQAIYPWVREATGLETFYPDELDASSTPRSLARHLAYRLEKGSEPPTRKPVIPFRDGPVKEPTVFVLTCPRSGSTLLRCMLMGHPMLYAPPELHLAQATTMKSRERNFTDAGVEWKTLGLAQTIAHLKGWNKWQAFHYVSQLTKRDLPIGEIYRLLHQLSPKQILVDKSPYLTSHISILQRIEEGFINPRYLFITRHPFSVLDSMMNNRIDPPRPNHGFKDAENVWLNANRNVLDFFGQVPAARHLRFSFEDLMADTDQILRQITDFLGIPYLSEMQNIYEEDRLQSGIGCVNLPKRKWVEKELGKKWKHIHLPGPLQEETRSLAASLGYTFPQQSP